MTSSTTQVSLVNRSLLGIGARANINSLTEVSTEAQAASILFSPTFTALARTARWGCLRRQGALSLLMAAVGTPENTANPSLPIPPQPFLYAYALPSDSLFVRGLQPSFPTPSTGGAPLTTVGNSSAPWIPSDGMIPFKVAFATDINNNPIEVILTNLSQAIGVWTTDNENPSTWDSLFEAAFVASLSAYFVPALSLNLSLMGAQIKNAEMAIATARMADGNETPVSQDHIPDWISARRSGTFYGTNNCGGIGYQSMNWPGAYGGGGAGIS